MRHLVDDVSTPLVFVEGIKKADATTSAARREGLQLLVVAISGVWNFLSDSEPIPDMFEVKLAGRKVTICFDSDMLRNPDVQDAAKRLAEHLIGRGAEVFITYLRDQADGSKTGADDFFAAGGTLAELRMLTRRYDPEDFVRLRLSRSEKLRSAITNLWRDWYERDWMHFVGRAERGNWARGHTARDVKEAFIELAMRRGKLDERGVLVAVGLRTLADMAAKSHESTRKAVNHLEADEQLEIIPAAGKDKPRSYRLLVDYETTRARVDSMGGDTAPDGKLGATVQGCQPLRAPFAPRLRWSSPGRSRRKEFELVPGRPVVRSTGRPPAEAQEVSPYIKRLGPHRGAVCDVVEGAGGEMHLEDLCEATNRQRPRDVRRRILQPLEEARVIELEGDVIRLARDWLDNLEAKREADGEIEQAERQREKHRKAGERYREHLEREKQGTPEASRAALRRSRELREERMREAREEAERDKAPTPPALEAFMRKILSKNDRIRMGLLCDLAREEGHRARDVPPAVRRMGYRIEELPEFGGAEFIYTDREAA
jgi:hypothetical protein